LSVILFICHLEAVHSFRWIQPLNSAFICSTNYCYPIKTLSMSQRSSPTI